jgi:hypothetical protein
MSLETATDDRATVAALSLMAMCLVTADHEAIGHGGVCLAVAGHIRLLTSALFRCDSASVWISPGGPLANLVGGLVALLGVAVVPRPSARTRLFLILVASLAFLWEGGYLMSAMVRREGDWYLAARDLLGEPSLSARAVGTLAGLGLYLVSARWTARALSGLWPDATEARRVARTAWGAATLGAVLAALAYSGTGWVDLRDASLEIGGATLPWLWLRSPRVARPDVATARIVRSVPIIVASLIVFALFVATLGRGLRF